MIPTIALPFKKMNTSQQINFAKKIVRKMSNDIRFQSLQPTVKDLSKKIEEWQIAISNAQQGGKIKTITKIEKGLTVMDKVFFLASRIEILAEFDDSLIAAAGYEKQFKVQLLNKAFSSQQIEEFLVASA